MAKKETPPSIEFFEEEPTRKSPLFSSALTRFVREASFGLIKNDTQAGLVVIALLIGAGIAAYYFIQNRSTIEPTVYYELLPQESVGSSQGLPPEVQYE